jgi:hypothetical protein
MEVVDVWGLECHRGDMRRGSEGDAMKCDKCGSEIVQLNDWRLGKLVTPKDNGNFFYRRRGRVIHVFEFLDVERAVIKLVDGQEEFLVESMDEWMTVF